MSFVIAAPEALVAVASDLAGIGSALAEANAAALAPTTAFDGGCNSLCLKMPLFRTRAALNLPSRARSTLLTPESYNGTPRGLDHRRLPSSANRRLLATDKSADQRSSRHHRPDPHHLVANDSATHHTTRDPDRWNGDLHLVRDDYGHRRLRGAEQRVEQPPPGRPSTSAKPGSPSPR